MKFTLDRLRGIESMKITANECSKCRREVHQSDLGWFHCEDNSEMCTGAHWPETKVRRATDSEASFRAVHNA